MKKSKNTARVLVVDDEADMCWALKKILEFEGVCVTVALSAKAAIAAVGKESFQVAFLDAKLPDVDGGELARQVVSASPETSCILISGYLYEHDGMVRMGFEEKSICAFISKPFDVKEVIDSLRAALANKTY